MLATYKRQQPALFGRLPQELYREIYLFDDTYRNIFRYSSFLLEIENMIIQMKYPIEYGFIQEFIKYLNGGDYKGSTNKRIRPASNRIPVEYKIQINKSNIPTLSYFIISTRNIKEYENDPNKYYGCVCDPTSIVLPNFHTQKLLKSKIKMKIPEISPKLVLYTQH